MKHETSHEDPLDALLARQPIQPSDDFARRTWERVCAEGKEDRPDPLDEDLDALLAAHPVKPSANFAARTCDRVRAEARPPRKMLSFPSWGLLGGVAAALAIGLFTVASLRGPVNSPRPVQTAARTAAMPPASTETLPDGVELIAFENVMSMEDTLDDALLLADSDTLSALEAFLN